MPYTVLAMLHVFIDSVLKHVTVAGNVFRQGREQDYFGDQEYREILMAVGNAWLPDDAEEQGIDENHITHMSAPMLAFVELKVYCCISCTVHVILLCCACANMQACS